MLRLVLVRHASTRATKRALFGDDDPLDARGREAAAALRGALPAGGGAGGALAAPCVGAFQTASVAGYAPVRIEAALGDCDYGEWTGRALADVVDSDPGGVAAWMADPDAVPHGGESVRGLIERVGGWLEGQAGSGSGGGTVVAFVPGAVVRAAVVWALGAPAEAFWRVDVAPAGVSELHAREGAWTVVRVNG